MIITQFAILYTMQIIIQNSICLNVIDLPQDVYKTKRPNQNKISFRASDMDAPPPQESSTVSPTSSPAMSPTTTPSPIPPSKEKSNIRRRWLLNEAPKKKILGRSSYEDEKDYTLKSKIALLVNQTMEDEHIRMQEIEHIKVQFRDQKPYRAGFVLSLIKKSRDVLNELFNVAVKHRDEWKALEQLKIFELIIHTNLDTTDLLRQLVDIHLGNSTSALPDRKRIKKV
ncbi:uncharacterized protein LOC118272922 [Spodoptera frugiperda]|uniref:Uncharacterized protein LOC118272922 n=1 Tax=Spodoptera frugiperda TaxID=7108 RepID=A0A9R0D9N9_SPOFR|nr:uncharacterized protein LOC118272922 [Spodoptera frugiperda]